MSSDSDQVQPTMYIAMYGGTYIYQFCQADHKHTLAAYQTDNEGQLHYIDTIVSGYYVNGLYSSPDGRHFAYLIEENNKTMLHVYYLDTVEKSIDLVFEWDSSTALNETVFTFTQDGKHVVLSESPTSVVVKSLYTNQLPMVMSEGFDAASNSISSGPTSQNAVPTTNLAMLPKSSCLIPGQEYVVWQQPSGRVNVIDMSRTEPYIWKDSVTLSTAYTAFGVYNDYLVHIGPDKQLDGNSKITILLINTVKRRMQLVTWSHPDTGYAYYYPGDNSLYFYNEHPDDGMIVDIPFTLLVSSGEII